MFRQIIKTFRSIIITPRVEKMSSMLSYFQRDGLPNPSGSLSSSLSPRAIAEANREVEKEITKTKEKRGSYNRSVRYSD